MDNTEKIFTGIGGKFSVDINSFAEKLKKVKALVFDWDGVFNRGEKSNPSLSSFFETDSMGINMLRFGFWLRDGKLPLAVIISGADNKNAIEYAKRENFDIVLTGVKQKHLALAAIQSDHGLKDASTAFFFDDIIDLKAASCCGLKIYFPKKATPFTNLFVEENRLFDYMPGSGPGNFPIREVCELMLQTMGLFNDALKYRMQYHEKFHRYITERNKK